MCEKLSRPALAAQFLNCLSTGQRVKLAQKVVNSADASCLTFQSVCLFFVCLINKNLFFFNFTNMFRELMWK